MKAFVLLATILAQVPYIETLEVRDEVGRGCLPWPA